MRKEKYYDLEMEIIRFDSDDIITSSPTEQDDGEVTDPDGDLVQDDGEI